MRAQSGTTSLRALLYMDEVFGYFPPVANPPSKLPLLTLLKQARAFGVGVVLATQNPVDLDYKGLANTGTLVHRAAPDGAATGRASSTGSRARPPAATSASTARRMEKILGGLGSRIFLLNNVHEDAPRGLRVALGRCPTCAARSPGPRSSSSWRAGSRPRRPRRDPPLRQRPRGPGAPLSAGARRGLVVPAAREGNAAGPPARRAPALPCPSAGARPAGAALVYQPHGPGRGHRALLSDAKAGVDQSEEVRRRDARSRRRRCR